MTFVPLDDLPEAGSVLWADFDVRRTATKTDDAWVNPDTTLLGTGRRPAPTFPLDLIGEFWGEWVTQRSKGASAPTDYIAVALLSCAGSMLGNVRWPIAGANWSEPPVLWAALVGSPSSGKSPAMDSAFDLLRHGEDLMAGDFEHVQRRFETDKAIAKATRDEWEIELKIALKAGETPPDMPSGADMPDPPLRPRVRVADATIEALGVLAAGLPRGLLMVRDEMAGWLGSFDRYGGAGSDRAFALEMYGGRSYVVDRKSSDPLRIRHLSIGVLGGIQPDKLPGILQGPDDGLAARLLWAWPEALPDFSLSREVACDTEARTAFARLTHLIMGADEFGMPSPKRVPLEGEAEDFLEAFARRMARLANEATGLFAGALGKARGHALRMSCIVEHMWWCPHPTMKEPTSITAEAMRTAIELLELYFLPMAERVFGDAILPEAERDAMVLIKHLRHAKAKQFNARQMRYAINGALRDAKNMTAACEVLIEAGLIRPDFDGHAATGRKPKNYEVNEVAFRAF